MTEEEKIRSIVHEAVKETLRGIGFNVDHPNEIQADLIYLNNIRTGSEEISRLVKKSVIAACIPAFLYILWEAIRHALLR